MRAREIMPQGAVPKRLSRFRSWLLKLRVQRAWKKRTAETRKRIRILEHHIQVAKQVVELLKDWGHNPRVARLKKLLKPEEVNELLGIDYHELLALEKGRISGTELQRIITAARNGIEDADLQRLELVLELDRVMTAVRHDFYQTR